MNLLKRIYDGLTAPLYNKLNHELKSGLQTQLQKQLDSQAVLMERIVDELTSINLQLEELRESPASASVYLKDREQKLIEIEKNWSSETIYSIITEMKKKHGLQRVMHTYDISASTAVQLDCKYHGMNAIGIDRVRRAAQQSDLLEEELNRLQANRVIENTAVQI